MRAIKNIRLKTYNYGSDGYYFVTINTNYGRPYLQGDIRNIVVAELARLNIFMNNRAIENRPQLSDISIVLLSIAQLLWQ